jgi:hypothetical protein
MVKIKINIMKIKNLIKILVTLMVTYSHCQETKTVSYYKNEELVNETDEWDVKEESIMYENGNYQTKAFNNEGRIFQTLNFYNNNGDQLLEIYKHHKNGFTSVTTYSSEDIKYRCLDFNNKIFFQDKDCLVTVEDDDSKLKIDNWIKRNLSESLTNYIDENYNLYIDFSISPEFQITINVNWGEYRSKFSKQQIESINNIIFETINSMPRSIYPKNFDLIGDQMIERKYTIPIYFRND